MRRCYYYAFLLISTVSMTILSIISINDVNLLQESMTVNGTKQEVGDTECQTNNYTTSYSILYPTLLKCNLNYTSQWLADGAQPPGVSTDYTQVANESTYDYRINRAVLIYYPAESTTTYEPEFRWFYQSWAEMQIYEPSKWRTDIVIFINGESSHREESAAIEFLKSHNCTFENKRHSRYDEPMCRLVRYVPLKYRGLDKGFNRIENDDEVNVYQYLYRKVNIFATNPDELREFYVNLKEKLQRYSYVDSILIAFDGYEELKDTYDFVIRSDIDVFLTPLFAKWLPKNCNDFYVGRGGYSDTFNIKRLRRVAYNLNLKYANIPNLGSTWYSTPEQIRLVSYLTLVSMLYLSSEEFSPPEKTFKQPLLWPYWHYGVLLLYGQNIAMNHLISNRELNIVKLSELIDVPTDSESSVFKTLHLHVYHGRNLFSKFSFKAGDYDNMTIDDESYKLSTARYYALNIALKSKHNNSIIKLKELEGLSAKN